MATSSVQKKIGTRRAVSESRARRTEERRRQIHASALQCFENFGYYETTINDIARASGVSSGLIYQYYSDKRDVLFQVILEILEAYNRSVPRAVVGIKKPHERLQAAAIAYFEVIASRMESTLLSYRESKSLDKDQIKILMAKEIQTNELIKECILDCIKQGLCRPVNAELITYSIITCAHMWSLKNWRLREICTHREYVVENLSMVLNHILTEEGKAEWSKNNLLASAG